MSATERCQHKWEWCDDCKLYVCRRCERRWFGRKPPEGVEEDAYQRELEKYIKTLFDRGFGSIKLKYHLDTMTWETIVKVKKELGRLD